MLQDQPATVLVSLYPWASHLVNSVRIGVEVASRGHSVTFLVPEKHRAALHTYAAERGLATQSYGVIAYDACSPLYDLISEEYVDNLPDPLTGIGALIAQSACTGRSFMNNATTMKAIQDGTFLLLWSRHVSPRLAYIGS